MAMRVSGINSGLDTDAIVQELVSAYSKKTEKYEKAQTKLSWKQETWKDLNTKIYSLYTSVSNMRFSSAYNTKKTTVSDSTKAKVTASSDAVTGTQKLNVLEMAQAGYVTGKKLELSTGEKVTSSTSLSELGYKGGDASIQVKTADGTTTIDIKKTTKISDLVKSLQDAGLNASFDENNQRMFVSAKSSGKDNDFVLMGSSKDGSDALKALGLDVALVETAEDGSLQFTAEGASYQADYDVYAAAQSYAGESAGDKVNAYLLDKLAEYDNAKAAKEAAEASSAELKAQNAELEQQKADSLSKIDLINQYNELDVTADDYDEKVAAIKESLAELEGDDVTADDIDLASYDVAALQQTADDADATIIANEAIIDANREIINTNKEIMVASPVAELAEEEDRDAAVAHQVQRAIDANTVLTSGNYTSSSAVKIAGCDAKIKLNNVEYTSSSNSFTINGLTIEAMGITGDGKENEISINTSIDAQGIYDKVKDFLTEYNTLINEMCKLYNADSAKDYEPLTDDEKDAMSDTEIEKWETKIKDSLLRRDTTLNSVMSAMINSMSTTYKVNGTTYSLSSFGIQTLGYLNAAENENYAYHIDGDEDDSNTSGNKDKLMAAIQEDPDAVIEFMKQLSQGLYTAIDNKMKSTTLSSAYKVYNDKEMDKQYAEYTETISKWEDKVAEKEEYYYDKFTAMETALGKLNSQTSSLSGLFGSY
ncbi:MAG: flagellar filament capping protein FliD [Agathobacter sp.]|nr:flagellar filament capping protein FliD [Agathobacter sp.]